MGNRVWAKRTLHYAFSTWTDVCAPPYNVVCNGITSNEELQLSPLQ